MAQELKTYDFPVDHGDFTTTIELFYIKSDVDAVLAEKDAEIRRLQRALYKACANWAHHRVFVRFKTNEKAWENVERKCRSKAEEYK